MLVVVTPRSDLVLVRRVSPKAGESKSQQEQQHQTYYEQIEAMQHQQQTYYEQIEAMQHLYVHSTHIAWQSPRRRYSS